MADDAMDWHPTTPPAPYNPYSHPRYIPGGWPRTPPSHRFTSGKFAKKRWIAPNDRPAKRSCTALRFIGSVAILPIRFILERLRRRQRDQRNSPRRDSAQDRRLSAAQRHQLSRQAEAESEAQRKAEDQAESTAWKLEQQRLTAEKRTTEGQGFNLPSQQPGADPERRIYRPFSGLSSTKTSPTTPAIVKSVIEYASSGASRRRLKRARKEEEQSSEHFRGSHPGHNLTGTASRSLKRVREEEAQTEYRWGSPSENHQSVSGQVTSRAPRSGMPSAAKRMRGQTRPNRFELNPTPIPLNHRELDEVSTTRMVKPIGTKLGDPDLVTRLFGGFGFEKPIEVTPPDSPNPPNQIPLELESHSSEHADVELQVSEHDDREPESRATSTEVDDSHTSVHKDNAPESRSIPAELHISKDREGDLEGMPTPAQVHDPRWSSELPLHIFFPEDFGLGDSTREENIDATEEAALVSPETPKWSVSQWLFGSSKKQSRPPIIKPRLVLSAEYQRALQQQPVVSSPTQKDAVKTVDHPESVAASSAVKEESRASSQIGSSQISPEIIKVEAVADVKSEDAKITEDCAALADTVTPLKVVAGKPAEQDLKTPSVTTTDYKIETPANKLAKLDIQDNQENDTPKATPHAGTRTTRVTRYREAVEKAQKAKLEQYELVPISNDWDKRVRSAVGNGIPGYLGPQDLARVVPQYSKHARQDNWLNDETINKYLEIVAEHGNKNDRPEQVKSHHAFNNFFYNNLNSRGASSVVRWSKRAKIGGKSLAYVEKVFVPINSGAHWTLAVVEPTIKRITHYNSMRGSAIGTKACGDLKDWVAIELGKDFKEEEWTLLAVGESPQQTNSDDCGIFTITSARQIMLGYAPMSYKAAQIPNQRKRIVAELINRGLLRSTADS